MKPFRTLSVVAMLGSGCVVKEEPSAPAPTLGHSLAQAEEEQERCDRAATGSKTAARVGQAVGACLEKEVAGPLAVVLELQLGSAGAKLLAHAGAEPLIKAPIQQRCIEGIVTAWTGPAVAEVRNSRLGLVERISLELSVDMSGDLRVRHRSRCGLPASSPPLVKGMEPLTASTGVEGELGQALLRCEQGLGSAAQRTEPLLFGLNLVRPAAGASAGVCSPVVENLPTGYITCVCAALLGRMAKAASRRSPSGTVTEGLSAGPATDKSVPQIATGQRYWLLRRKMAAGVHYHQLEGLGLDSK